LLGIAGAALILRTRAVLTREFDAALRAQAAMVVSDTEYDEDAKSGSTLPASRRPTCFITLCCRTARSSRVRPASASTTCRARRRFVLPEDEPVGCASEVRSRAGRGNAAGKTEHTNRDAGRSPATVSLWIVRLAGIWAGLLIVGATVLALQRWSVTLAIRRGLRRWTI